MTLKDLSILKDFEEILDTGVLKERLLKSYYCFNNVFESDLTTLLLYKIQEDY